MVSDLMEEIDFSMLYPVFNVRIRTSRVIDENKTDCCASKVSKQAIFKKIQERCKKIRVCYYCGSMNGQVRKVPNAQTLKLVHEKYKVKEHVNSAEAVEERQAKVSRISDLPLISPYIFSAVVQRSPCAQRRPCQLY